LSHNLKEQVKRLNIEKENVERKNIALYEKISTYLPWATQTSFYFIVKGVNHDIRHYLKRQSDFINQVLNSNTAPRELILNNQKELDRTVEMIENLLDIFDFDSSKKDMCDVNEIIEKIIYHFKKVEPTITYNMKKSYISDVFCYKPELTMIIYNIVNNAVFAVNKKFKDRKLKQGIIEFNTHSSENKVFITIKDNGIGIAKDDIGKIYDQNYSKKGGMGIGLYFVKQVLNLNFEGDIECKSKLGHWTKFTLKLPLSVNYK